MSTEQMNVNDMIFEMVDAVKKGAEELADSYNEKRSTKELNAALAKAQAEIKPPVKNRKVDFTHNGQRTKYAYADLADVIEAIKLPLSKHGLSISHALESPAAGKFGMRTTLLHSSGESRSTWYPLADPTNMKPQSVGSALTYARRYSLSGLVGIASDEDDDGAAGAPETQQPPAQRAKPPAKKPPAAATGSQPMNMAPASNTEKQKIVSCLKQRQISTDVFMKYLKTCYGTDDVKTDHVDPLLEILQDEMTNEATLMAFVAQATTSREMDQRPESEQSRFAPPNGGKA